MPEFLTIGEFNRRMDQQDRQLTRIVSHMDQQVAVNANTQTELALLKVSHTKSRNLNAGISSAISAIVAGITSALMSKT